MYNYISTASLVHFDNTLIFPFHIVYYYSICIVIFQGIPKKIQKNSKNSKNSISSYYANILFNLVVKLFIELNKLDIELCKLSVTSDKLFVVKEQSSFVKEQLTFVNVESI